jgi:hypothetical protein
MTQTSQDRFLKENISREDLMNMFEDALLMLYTLRREDPSIEYFVECCLADGFSIDPTEPVGPDYTTVDGIYYGEN